jgi:hypothetical protein
MTERREIIEATVADVVKDFLYYERKDDEELPRGAIEQAIHDGEITIQEIIDRFGSELRTGIAPWQPR